MRLEALAAALAAVLLTVTLLFFRSGGSQDRRPPVSIRVPMRAESLRSSEAMSSTLQSGNSALAASSSESLSTVRGGHRQSSTAVARPTGAVSRAKFAPIATLKLAPAASSTPRSPLWSPTAREVLSTSIAGRETAHGQPTTRQSPLPTREQQAAGSTTKRSDAQALQSGTLAPVYSTKYVGHQLN